MYCVFPILAHLTVLTLGLTIQPDPQDITIMAKDGARLRTEGQLLRSKRQVAMERVKPIPKNSRDSGEEKGETLVKVRPDGPPSKQLQEQLWRSVASNDPRGVANAASAGADVNAMYEGRDGWAEDPSASPLHFALEKGHLEAARALLLAGADAHGRDQWDYSAVFRAARGADPDMLALILTFSDIGNHLGLINRTLLQELSRSAPASDRVLSGARFLIKHGGGLGDRDAHLWSAVHYAADAGNLPLLGLYLGLGADLDSPDLDGCTPLLLAICAGHQGVVAFLLRNGADPNVKSKPRCETALRIAAERCDSVVVRMLLDSGARVADSNCLTGESALHKAVQADCSVALVALLLDRGADRDARNRRGETPLRVARLGGRTRLAELLRAKGARDLGD